MLARLLVLRPVLQTLVNIEEGKYYPNAVRLTEDEWLIVHIGCTILKPLMFAQTMLEGELYITNSLVAPIIYEIRNHLYAVLERVKKHII